MNYLHHYHAGNFADVFKHALLIELLKAFSKKDKAFCYIDTHAGSGCYDLTNAIAQKNQEYSNGIERLMQYSSYPGCLRDYIETVREYGTNYPGSPLIASHFMRSQDRMMLNEFHPEEFQKLRLVFEKKKHVLLYEQDAYALLKALLPPKEKRGIILIDPPFEDKNEFDHILNGLKEGLKRFATGTYAVWYPIKDRHPIDRFYRKVIELPPKNILACEFMVFSAETSALGLNGCGLLVLNPPWQIEKTFEPILQILVKVLGQKDLGSYHLKWLKHE